jgi:peroxiredoxin
MGIRMKFTKPLLIAAAVLAVAGALFYALMDKPGAPAATFMTLEGKPIALNELRGKVVLVNFWATSCPGCIKEMPEMIQTYQTYKDRGFEVIAVAMSYDPPNYVASFAKTRQLPFPVALDVNGAHARAFGDVQLTPTSFIIGKDGTILEQKLGELDFAKLHALLDRELS